MQRDFQILIRHFRKFRTQNVKTTQTGGFADLINCGENLKEKKKDEVFPHDWFMQL